MVTVVFGARGKVGRHVAAGLIAQGGRVRVTGRDPDPADFPTGAQVIAADLARPETLSAALEDAERVFLYAVPDGIDEFVAAAETAGVRHVVLLSSGAVLPDEAQQNSVGRMHRVVETAIEKSGLDWTFIRPGMFATNALWWWRRSIRDEGRVRMPYPEARTAPVHERDLAALAVAALTEPVHAHRAYSVWGPEALTLRQQVQHIGAAVGREIAVEMISVEQARAELRETVPAIGVEAVLAGWQAGTAGTPATSTVVEEVTGNPARTFAQWAVDHADDFR
ncbi:NAD(P)H-binding protein [Nocardia sp. NPDC003963]